MYLYCVAVFTIFVLPSTRFSGFFLHVRFFMYIYLVHTAFCLLYRLVTGLQKQVRVYPERGRRRAAYDRLSGWKIPGRGAHHGRIAERLPPGDVIPGSIKSCFKRTESVCKVPPQTNSALRRADQFFFCHCGHLLTNAPHLGQCNTV